MWWLSLAVRKGQQPPWMVPDGLWERIEPLLPVVPRRADRPGRRSVRRTVELPSATAGRYPFTCADGTRRLAEPAETGQFRARRMQSAVWADSWRVLTVL